MGTFLPGSGLGMLGDWLEHLTPQGVGVEGSVAKAIPPNFYLPHMSVGGAHPVYTLPS